MIFLCSFNMSFASYSHLAVTTKTKMASPECSSNACAKDMLKVPFVVVLLFLDGLFINSMES